MTTHPLTISSSVRCHLQSCWRAHFPICQRGIQRRRCNYSNLWGHFHLLFSVGSPCDNVSHSAKKSRKLPLPSCALHFFPAVPVDKLVFFRDRSSRLYSVSSYYMAVLASEIPNVIVLPLVTAAVGYYTIALQSPVCGVVQLPLQSHTVSRHQKHALKPQA
mgnify:CR=1 FL=1